MKKAAKASYGKKVMAKGGTLAPSKKSTSTNLASYKRPIGKNLTGKSVKTMKSGGKMKTCKSGC